MPGLSHIRRGYSLSTDPVTAVRELHDAIAQPSAAVVVFFCSSAYDLDALGAELQRRFEGVTLIGCTTAGEITPMGYQEGSITGFSIGGPGSRAVTTRIDCLGDCAISAGFLAAEELMGRLSQGGPPVTDTNTFGLMLIDGMSAREEVVVSTIHWGMGAIPLLGGSAGDDMHLSNTFVYHEGAFRNNAALLALVQLDAPFRTFNTKHFRGTEEKLVVTKADPERRLVLELNAAPAAAEYARTVGCKVSDLSAEMFGERTLMVKIGGEYYVRSIQQVLPCGSLVFYSAMEQGVVLTLAERQDLLGHLGGLFASIRADLGPPELVIGFDCVLRAREAERHQIRHQAGRMLADNKVIGFSTYGEQFSAMHLNQTFTGVALGHPRAACDVLDSASPGASHSRSVFLRAC
jgi:hypothetical protein